MGQRNVIPAEIKAIFDLRLSTNTDPKEFEKMLVKWIEEAEGEDADSGNISFEFQSVLESIIIASEILPNRIFIANHEICPNFNGR